LGRDEDGNLAQTTLGHWLGQCAPGECGDAAAAANIVFMVDDQEAGVCELSVVVPVYGCGPCLAQLHERLVLTLETLDVSYEVVMVDDRSPDDAWNEIEALVALDRRVCGVRLSRNFGQHAAITAGLSRARGRWVVVLDCDLQDPPEEIPRLYHEARRGHDIVFGRRARKPTGLARRLLARMYFGGLRLFAGVKIDGQYGTFSIISRDVVNAFLALQDRDRHYLFILSWLGFDTATVDYVPAVRYAGKSSYSLRRLLTHGLDGVFFQTTVLLRWIVYLGFAVTVCGVAGAIYLVSARLGGTAYPGWTSVMVLLLALCGFIILSTGTAGLYVGKIFEQSRGRPLFVIDRVAIQRDASIGHDSEVVSDRDASLARR
jgi:glycosyltransferase involved in cell wall biosynthesis